MEESPELLLELPGFGFGFEEPSNELTALLTPEPEAPELGFGFGFDPEEPRREVTADFTLELVEVPPELPELGFGFGFDPEEPRRELTADFTLELLDVPPLDDDLDPRAEDTADLILEAVLLTLLEVELLRLELEPLLELLLLELLLLLLVLLWASIPATSRMRKRRSKGSLIAKQRQEQTVAPATVCWLIDLQIPDTSSYDTHAQPIIFQTTYRVLRSHYLVWSACFK